jgi:dephospho-CoA kinase
MTTTLKLVIGIAGMPGAGKSIVVNTAKENSYSVVVMGNVVREETARRGLEPSPENIGRIMLELRDKEGDSVIAKRCIPKIDKAKETKVLVDGVRSLSEVEEFKKHYPKFTLIAVHASPETRFQRLYHRRRSDDSADWKVFHERDMRELSVGLGNAISMAEHIIINEETLDIAKTKAKEVLRKVEEKWTT